ncbi:MAG: TonB-dependent receptor [Tannerellaceae bacterium]|jgi:TonB-linked SusC/RagA family outer membrane protein|nr:TonB-dependent receptor [Tannerellaceae bacterium]
MMNKLNSVNKQIKRVMKLILVFMIACLGIQAQAEDYSQQTRITLDMQNKTVREVLDEIERVSDLAFFYRSNIIDESRRLNISVQNQTIDKVLDMLLSQTGNSYTIKERQVYIDRKASPASATAAPQQSRRTVAGIVVDANNETVIGANIIEMGTTNGTVTGTDGRFSLSVGNNAKLQVSYIGYITQEIAVGSRTNLRIVLADDSQALEEVIVIGYGTIKKSDLTGAVASVKSEDLNKMATSSPVQALQGRAAGVMVIQDSGQPDAIATIKIRGIGTTNNADPLFVVDGFPMDDINFLSPSDIESLEILKDASACAIYGSRGANGVVLVTTKKGKAGALKVSVNAYYGIENLANKPSMLNSSQYAALSNEAYVNNNEAPLYANTSNLPTTDWYKEVSRTGAVRNYNLSLSGGGDNMTSMFSANYFKRNGIIRSTDFDRISMSQNNNMKVGNILKFTTSISAAFSANKRMDPTSIFLSSLIAPPDVPVWNNDTDYYAGISKIRLANPVGRIARNNAQNRNMNLVGNFSVDLNITSDLVFTSRFGIRYDGTYNSGFTPVYYETMDNSELTSTVSRSTQRYIEWTWENIATWHKTFGKVHDLTVMAAMSARERNRDSFRATKQNVPIESEQFWYFDSATDNPQANGDGSSLSMLSYLGRINYNILNRYLITASVRHDGSSRFLGKNRWGTFPSFSVAWKLSEESFFKSLDIAWLTSLKVRAGYGELGNENIRSYYPYLTPIAQRHYYTTGAAQTRVNGAGLSGIGNAAAQWETSTQTNVGVDLALMDNRLNAVFDYFVRKTDNILLSQQIPQISGSGSIVRNVGGIENRGFELTLSWRDSKGPFSYNVSGNISPIKNKITNLGTSAALVSSFDYDYVLIDFQGALGNILRSEVGLPFRQFYGYQTDGIFQSQAEVDAHAKDGKPIQADAKTGDFRFKDNNDNGRIDDGDMTFIGNPVPDFTYGFSFDASYGRFDLNMLWQGVQGNDVYNAAKYYFMRFDARHNVRVEYLDSYWKSDRTDAAQPIVTRDLTRNTRNYRNSDLYVEDGSYLRLKTLQLGYNLSLNLSRSFKTSMRLYLSAQNLLTLTKYSGFEPEVSDIAVDRGQYPQSRSYMLGTVINF